MGVYDSMIMRAYIFIDNRNTDVQKTYLNVISESLQLIGFHCEYVYSLEEKSKDSLIVFSVGVEAFKYYIKGYHNIILWIQGVAADESFLRHHSKLRYKILNFIDCFMIKKSIFVFFVSHYMKKHYEELTEFSFDNKAYIMPCYNEEYDSEIFKQKNYNKKTFTYVGSLDLWQCFDSIVDIYKQIEFKFPNALFKVLTFQVEEARKILSDKKIKNYIVKYVPSDEVKKELLEVNYGFVIRRDSIINRVATPTKISSYLAAGVLPIYSKCLIDFAKISNGYNCVLGIQNTSEIESIIEFIKQPINEEIIKKEIKDIFNAYYNSHNHIMAISCKLKRCLDSK